MTGHTSRSQRPPPTVHHAAGVQPSDIPSHTNCLSPSTGTQSRGQKSPAPSQGCQFVCRSDPSALMHEPHAGAETVTDTPTSPFIPPPPTHRDAPLSHCSHFCWQSPPRTSRAGGALPTKLMRGFPAKGSSPREHRTPEQSLVCPAKKRWTRVNPEVEEGTC